MLLRTPQRPLVRLFSVMLLASLSALAPLLSVAAAPQQSDSPGVITMGPQAMEGDLKVQPGETLWVGYSFTMPGNHPAATLNFAGSQVSFAYTCVASAGTGTFVVPIDDQSSSVPANSSAWYPSGDQHSPAVYQGARTVPDVCNGGRVRLQQGGTFSASVSADTANKVNIRWHYSAHGTSGSWSGTKSVVPSASEPPPDFCCAN
jgi:hypothetical protein